MVGAMTYCHYSFWFFRLNRKHFQTARLNLENIVAERFNESTTALYDDSDVNDDGFDPTGKQFCRSEEQAAMQARREILIPRLMEARPNALNDWQLFRIGRVGKYSEFAG